MNNDRKRVKTKPLPKLEPKKREEIIIKKKPIHKTEPQEIDVPKERKQKGEDKYVKLPTTAKPEEFRLMSERVQRGEVKWAYYATDGDKGYHHYILI